MEIARRHGVVNIRVFGSVARGDADSDSDIDLLVELEPDRSLFDLGGLLMDLRDFFGGPVDVVTSAALQERVHARVMRESSTAVRAGRRALPSNPMAARRVEPLI